MKWKLAYRPNVDPIHPWYADHEIITEVHGQQVEAWRPHIQFICKHVALDWIMGKETPA